MIHAIEGLISVTHYSPIHKTFHYLISLSITLLIDISGSKPNRFGEKKIIILNKITKP